MASDAFNRFYANGAMDVPASIQATLQPVLFEVLRDFMQHTNVWKSDVNITVDATNYTYTFTPPAGTAVKRLMNFYNPTDTTKRWTWPVVLELPSTLRLGRLFDQPYTYVATLSLYAVDPVDGDGNPIFPAWILDNYFDTLYSGMLWRMFAQPSKPWSNVALAGVRYRMYMKGRGEALAETQRGNTFDNQNWTYPMAGTTFGRQRGA